MHQRRNVIIAITAAVIGTAAQVLVPLIARQIVDKVIVARTDSLWPWLVMLFAAATLTFVLAYVRRYRGGKMALGVQLELRNCDPRPAPTPRPRHPVDVADRPARLARQLRLDARPGSAQLPAVDDRKPADDGAVARRHVLAVTGARPARAGDHACAVRRVVPVAAAGVPGELGRPATRGRCRTDRRRGRHRRPGRQGVRAGGTRTQPAGRVRATAVRLTDARHPAARPLPAGARGDPELRAGRDPRARRAPRHPRQHHPRHVPRVLDLRRTVRRARAATRRSARGRPAGPRRRGADLPAHRPAADRSPTRPTRSNCRTCVATSGSTTSVSTSATDPCWTSCRCTSRRANASRSSARAAAESRR